MKFSVEVIKLYILAYLGAYGDHIPTLPVWEGHVNGTYSNCLRELRVTNSSRPPANLKEKGNPDLPTVCSNYLPPNVAQFVF